MLFLISRGKCVVSALMLSASVFCATPLSAAQLVPPPHAGAIQSDPVALLQYAANNMVAALRENRATLKTQPKVVYDLSYKYVVPYADLTLMARQVLPPQTWNNASAAERAKFQHEFTITLIRTYASALSSYRDQTVTIYPVRGGYEGKRTVEVQSRISNANGEPIEVSYRMVKVGSAWRLYDLSVEGVSMLASFRSQFADILSQGNMSALLSRMSGHNNG